MVLPVKVTLTKKDLESYANEPLKETLKVYKKQVASRNKYIKKLHQEIKSKRNVVMAAYVMEEVSSVMPKILTKKRMIILAELYEKEYISESRLRELMKKLDMAVGHTGSDFKQLIDNGLIQKHNRSSYYITDAGKQFVEYFQKTVSSLFGNMLANRGDFRIAQAKKKVVISDKLRQTRSDNYRMMMQPFWDSNLTKMPKDRENRCKILWEWMTKNEKQKDNSYLRMLHRWSSKK